MTKKAGDKRKWEGVAKTWGKINPPYSPSLGGLKIYEKWMRKIKKKNERPKLLILGVTPSLRELGFKLGFEVTCVDINLKMIEETNKLIEEKNPKEKIIVGDWLKVELPEESFDLIVSDHSTNNVNFKDWNKLFERIKKFLKKNGTVILVATVFDEGSENLDFEDLVKRIKQNPKLLENQLDRWYLRYCFHSHPNVKEDKTKAYHTDWFDMIIDRLYNEGKVTLYECKKLKFELGIWAATFVSKKEFREFAERYFKVVKTEWDKSHKIFKYQQFFIMKK